MPDIHPVRLRLSRARGFNLQAHSRAVNGLPAVNCARPGPLGNPFMVDVYGVEQAIDLHRRWIEGRISIGKIMRLEHYPEGNMVVHRMTALRHLKLARGHNLACACAFERPCHADTLLELVIANG